MKWISVKDRLPEAGTYKVKGKKYSGEEIVCKSVSFAGGLGWATGGRKIYVVTHWLEPDPPQEVDEESEDYYG